MNARLRIILSPKLDGEHGPFEIYKRSSLFRVFRFSVESFRNFVSYCFLLTFQTLCLTLLLAASGYSARLDHLVPQGYAPVGAGAANAQPYNYENVNNGDGTYRFR